MGTKTGRGHTTLDDALDACKRLTGLEVRPGEPRRRQAAPDQTILDVIPGRGQRVRFVAIDRPNLRAEAVGALVDLGRGLPHPLLVAAPHVDPVAAERARELGLAFVDTAGNAIFAGRASSCSSRAGGRLGSRGRFGLRGR